MFKCCPGRFTNGGPIMASYPVQAKEPKKCTVKAILNLEDRWAFFGSDGSLIQYPREKNPKPNRNDVFRVYKTNDGRMGLFLKTKSGEVHDIVLEGMKPVVRNVESKNLSEERKRFGLSLFFMQPA